MPAHTHDPSSPRPGDEQIDAAIAAPPYEAAAAGGAIEANGINVVAESERRGKPSDLFKPWFAANISVLGMSYGAYVLGFGISFWQAVVVSVVGVVVSFLLVGFASLAGKVGSAPTMILSRAAFGVRGNAVPTAIGYLILIGWEIILVSLSTMATSTVCARLGLGSGNGPKVVAFLVVVLVVTGAGVFGFDAVMRLQGVITWLTGVLTLVYMGLTWSHVDWAQVSGHPAGSVQAVLGALVFLLTAFGLSWVNSASDYSRYLPRTASSAGVIGWTTFGASVAPVVLVLFGLLLAGSDAQLSGNIAGDPIGALTTLLPTWFLVPFAVVAVLGLVGGATLDIYSSGLTLLALGLRTPRWVAAAFDAVLMVLGTIYVVWIAPDFLGPFMGFLMTLGVPLAAWVGIYLADLALRTKGYRDAALYDAGGIYGALNPVSLALLVIGAVLGWGLVTSQTPGFQWQGYLLGAGLGGRQGQWATANLGVLVALLLGFVGYLLLGRPQVRRQESTALGDLR